MSEADMWLWRRKGRLSSWSSLKAQEKAAACDGDKSSDKSLAATIGLNLGGSLIEEDKDVKDMDAASEIKEEGADNDRIIDI